MEQKSALEMKATIHVDTSELDAAIEKANQLLVTLRELQEKAGLVLVVQGQQKVAVSIRCPDVFGNGNANDLVKKYRQRIKFLAIG